MVKRQLDPGLFSSCVEQLLKDRDPSYAHGADIILVAVGVSPAQEALVIYRESIEGPLTGLRIDLSAFASKFKPDPDEVSLARTVVWDEMADPSGPGPNTDADLDVLLLGVDKSVGWRFLAS